MVSALEFCRQTAREAGKLLLRLMANNQILHVKSSNIDLVTEADYRVQEYIAHRIHKAFPDHEIVGEEGEDSHDHGHTWFIDPLDGTTNYWHHVPFFAVSLALCYNHEPQVGAVYAPFNDESFWAERGSGAFGDTGVLHVSAINSLDQALVATGFPYQREPGSDNNLIEFGRVMPFVQEVRRFGSAALELAYVAAGRFDGYWEFYTKPWDIMAGQLLVLEAGGQISTVREGTVPTGPSGILATNGHIHEPLQRLLLTGG